MLAHVTLDAQQFPQLTQFALSKYQMNQAYGGMDRSLSANVISRNQWSDLVGRPSTVAIDANLPLYNLSGAAGILVRRESLGAISQTSVRASFNYVLESDIGVISLAGTAGMMQIGLDGNALKTPSGIYEDGIIDHNDLTLLSSAVSGQYAIWSLGAMLRTNTFEMAGSVQNLVGGSSISGDFNSQIAPEVNFFFQYNLPRIGDIRLMPSMLVKSDLAVVQSDVVVLAQYDRLYYGGLGLRGYSPRSIDAVNVILGYQISKHYRLSYSYDYGLSSLARFHSGTHEFVINYNLAKPIGKRKESVIIYSPRFL